MEFGAYKGHNLLFGDPMTKITKTPVLVAGAVLLSFAATSYAHPKKHEDMSQTEQTQKTQKTMSHDNHTDMKMEKKDKPKMDMSKISAECQTVLKKMNDHGMKNTEGHDMEKMKTKKAKHEKCMTEMKEAMSHKP